MKRVLLFLIRLYQKYLSPGLPRRCRFSPTCSQYALEAITKYGAVKGGWLALKRLLRCNPFYKGDYFDPVPKGSVVFPVVRTRTPITFGGTQ